MSYPIGPPAESLLRPRQSLMLARLWWIIRTDNFYLRLTDHDHELVGPDGQIYTPMGGFDPTAIRKAAGLEDQNADFRGVLSSGAITFDDLRVGRWDEAEINEYVVDFRFPWAGTMQHTRVWISETRFDGEQWHAQISGIPYWLRFNVGRTHTRTCDADLGDARCGVDVTPLQQSGSVTVVLEDRIEFEISLPIGQSDGFFDDGEVVWQSGPNLGLLSQVRSYEDLTPRKMRLYLRTPFPVVVGDTFLLTPGCNKLGRTGDCKNKFNNLVNFRGFEDIPGTNDTLRTPTT